MRIFTAIMPDSLQTKNRFSRWFVIFSLVFAGEMIFSLPFHIARFFRPTFLEVFKLTNAELGDAIAIYGIMAMLAYFPGGTLADRFSARKLMSISLFATALGGIFLAQIPGQFGLSIVFGYWGITTIFLFWGAMIKTTRNWGGKLSQGKAFGILDGGRGLVAAGAATLAVIFLSKMLPNPDDATELQRSGALKTIIYYYTLLTFAAAIVVWFVIPDSSPHKTNSENNLLSGIGKVIRNRTVWLQAIIVVCAYSGYKGLDYYSLYAVDVLEMNEVDAAQFVSNASYLRAVAAIGAGLLVDRLSASKVISWTFGLLVISYFILSVIGPNNTLLMIIYGNIIFTFIAVYALRGVYFSLLEETKIRSSLTGTAVGLISVIGYTPDAFFNSVAGRILDASPGLKGHQHFYMLLAVFSMVGMVATVVLGYFIKDKTAL